MASRMLGDGKPHFQPCWYLVSCLLPNLPSTSCGGHSAQPASHTHFNNHPMVFCRAYHPQNVVWVIGCSVHQGVRDNYGRCVWCEYEKTTGRLEQTIPLQWKVGYPGDGYIWRDGRGKIVSVGEGGINHANGTYFCWEPLFASFFVK